MGEREKAQKTFEELLQLSGSQYVQRFCIAVTYVGLGEMDRAFDLLEHSYEQREGNLISLKQITALMPGLLADSRLTDLMCRIELPS